MPFGRVTVALLIVAVPVVAPKVRVVAAPPIFKVVAPVLKRVALVFVVVRSPPLIAISEPAVTSPVRRDVPSTVSVPAAWMLPAFEIVTPVEAYPPPRTSESTVVTALAALSEVAFGKEKNNGTVAQ